MQRRFLVPGQVVLLIETEVVGAIDAPVRQIVRVPAAQDVVLQAAGKRRFSIHLTNNGGRSGAEWIGAEAGVQAEGLVDVVDAVHYFDEIGEASLTANFAVLLQVIVKVNERPERADAADAILVERLSRQGAVHKLQLTIAGGEFTAKPAFPDAGPKGKGVAPR